MARMGFEPRPCWSRARRFNHSTTLPTKFYLYEKTNDYFLYKLHESYVKAERLGVYVEHLKQDYVNIVY